MLVMPAGWLARRLAAMIALWHHGTAAGVDVIKDVVCCMQVLYGWWQQSAGTSRMLGYVLCRHRSRCMPYACAMAGGRSEGPAKKRTRVVMRRHSTRSQAVFRSIRISSFGVLGEGMDLSGKIVAVRCVVCRIPCVWFTTGHCAAGGGRPCRRGLCHCRSGGTASHPAAWWAVWSRWRGRCALYALCYEQADLCTLYEWRHGVMSALCRVCHRQHLPLARH